ncbi:MAG: hypothetical protein ACLVI9_07535 [Anaerostipes hadrus]
MHLLEIMTATMETGNLYQCRWYRKIAPVYDNGNCLFNKRNPSVAERRILNENDIRQDALGTGVSFFTQENEKHIHPFQYIKHTK